MMSNCAYWCQTGELWAVHGAGPDDPRGSFLSWIRGLRVPPGRLVMLSRPDPSLVASTPGWQWVDGVPRLKRRQANRPFDGEAPVAVFAPLLDQAAHRVLPLVFHHEKFTFQAAPTWVSSVRLAEGETTLGWWAALSADQSQHQFLVRMVPYRGRLPGEGWRNMLGWVLRQQHRVKLVPLTSLPRAEALAGFPAWEYRVEAGQGLDRAAWDVQILPSKTTLTQWSGGCTDPWEATARLRWIRSEPVTAEWAEEQGSTEPVWPQLLGRLPVADARRLVQNVLTTLDGGAAEAASLFFETLSLPAGPGGRSMVRHVPQPGIPASMLSTLFGRRAWQEVERAKRSAPSAGQSRELSLQTLAEVDRRLREGRLVWSDEANALWERIYRQPLQRSLERQIAEFRTSSRWNELLSGDHRRAEYLLRTMDVTDVALCLRDAPDTRWRRFVTATREREIKAEVDFCHLWQARGELTAERELDAWSSWDEALATYEASLPLT